jgi:acetyl-CoA carboxylase biotin carboxyl carrier protein
MMVANDIVELNVRDGDQEIKLKRPNPNAGEMFAIPAAHPGGTQMAHAAQPHATGETRAEDPADEAHGLLHITSPMVGTFYAAPDPDSPPFVQVGAKVGPSSVVCVLEAMKVFSEIKAELSGTIERVLVKNEEAVEFGQLLFLVRPD